MPDPDLMNPDLKHCFLTYFLKDTEESVGSGSVMRGTGCKNPDKLFEVPMDLRIRIRTKSHGSGTLVFLHPKSH